MKPEKFNLQQAPLRNASIVGAHVYSHSGEFSPEIMDLELRGRGVSFQFTRKYRSSLCGARGPLGHGWTFTYAKRIEMAGKDIIYHDGYRRKHRFSKTSAAGQYRSPDGFYAVLIGEKGRFLLQQRYGGVFAFEAPDAGGRLLSIADRNNNQLIFSYRKAETVATDSLGRRITIAFDKDRVTELRDHTNRTWQYIYSDNDCLIEIIQPPTDSSPNGPRVKYGYDEKLRLVSITNPNGDTVLRNDYDRQGRIVRQSHGNGTFEFQYKTIGKTDTGDQILKTEIKLKNGGRLLLRHDASGHVETRTLFVTRDSLSPEDRGGSTASVVPLTTTSKFNAGGELIERAFPAGNVLQQLFEDGSSDMRNRGNLLQATWLPAPGVKSDQPKIVTKYEYEPTHQRCSAVTDPRGHTTKFKHDGRGNVVEKIYPQVTVQDVGAANTAKKRTRSIKLVERFDYNAAGQLLRATDARGVSTENHYYPATDPTGVNGPAGIIALPDKAAGFLARIVRDADGKDRRVKTNPAKVTTGLRYDLRGNVTSMVDGKSNSTRFAYDSQDRMIGATSREPFSHETSIRRDANGNMLAAIFSFERNEFDPVGRQIVRKSTTVRQGFEYNSLNNLTRRTLAADGREIGRSFIRDDGERITRVLEPMGTVVEYIHDERDLQLAQRAAPGTKEEAVSRDTYTPNGQSRSTTDGNGNTTHFHYDGFHRYVGLTNPAGTTQKQRRDEAGNIVEIEVVGDPGMVDDKGAPKKGKAMSLLNASFVYDELNRCARINRAWHDISTGASLGNSQYDDQSGVVSAIIEYGENHLPAKAWSETGNIWSFDFDGANRLAGVSDETGESVSVEYDENGNAVKIERLGPEGEAGEERFRQTVTQRFDELDRPVLCSLNAEPPVFYAYNSLGTLTSFKNQAGVATHCLQDSLGRSTGGAVVAVNERASSAALRTQMIVERLEWDDNNRLASRTTATDHQTRYHYDSRNTLVGVTYADGTTLRYERDPSGNVVGVRDANGNLIANKFDSLNRLVQRDIDPASGAPRQTERYQFNGVSRIVAAVTGAATVVCRYDSLSRLLAEVQTGRRIEYAYDGAGNCIRLGYPSGEVVHRSFDKLRRITEIRDAKNTLIASYTYRSGAQLRSEQLGNVLRADYDYEPGRNDRVKEIAYRHIRDGKLIEGSRYLFDAVGNRMLEVQAQRGDNSGERYYFDSASHLVAVQYGVEDLTDPNSRFEEEVQYELDPASSWRHRTTRDGDGRITEATDGTSDQRDAYRSLGSRRFEYDANGNRIAEENAGTQKRYEYDYANRLARVESKAADGAPTQTLEYAYDAFNRQVLKRVTSGGSAQELGRLWIGQKLIEETVGDSTRNTYIYRGDGNTPLEMTHHNSAEAEKVLFTVNGRGLVTGLSDQRGEIIERYQYDVFGQPSVSLVGGVPSATPATQSNIGNSLLGRGAIFDNDAKIYFQDGVAFDASTAEDLGSGPQRDEHAPGNQHGGTSGSSIWHTISEYVTIEIFAHGINAIPKPNGPLPKGGGGTWPGLLLLLILQDAEAGGSFGLYDFPTNEVGRSSDDLLGTIFGKGWKNLGDGVWLGPISVDGWTDLGDGWSVGPIEITGSGGSGGRGSSGSGSSGSSGSSSTGEGHGSPADNSGRPDKPDKDPAPSSSKDPVCSEPGKPITKGGTEVICTPPKKPDQPGEDGRGDPNSRGSVDVAALGSALSHSFIPGLGGKDTDRDPNRGGGLNLGFGTTRLQGGRGGGGSNGDGCPNRGSSFNPAMTIHVLGGGDHDNSGCGNGDPGVRTPAAPAAPGGG